MEDEKIVLTLNPQGDALAEAIAKVEEKAEPELPLHHLILLPYQKKNYRW